MPPLAARTARRFLLVPPLMVVGLLGFGLAFQTSASEASSTCSLYAAPGGSDSAGGW